MCEIWDAQSGVIQSIKIGNTILRTKGHFPKEKIMEAARLLEEVFIIPPLPPSTVSSRVVTRTPAIIEPESPAAVQEPVKQKAKPSQYKVVDRVKSIPIEKEPVEKIFNTIEDEFVNEDIFEILKEMYPDNTETTVWNKTHAYIKYLISNGKAAATNKVMTVKGKQKKMFILKRFKGIATNHEVADQLETENTIHQSKVNKSVELD